MENATRVLYRLVPGKNMKVGRFCAVYNDSGKQDTKPIVASGGDESQKSFFRCTEVSPNTLCIRREVPNEDFQPVT